MFRRIARKPQIVSKNNHCLIKNLSAVYWGNVSIVDNFILNTTIGLIFEELIRLLDLAKIQSIF